MLNLYFALQLRLTQLRDSERGAIAVEYGLLIVLIAVALVAATGFLKDAIVGAFNDGIDALNG